MTEATVRALDGLRDFHSLQWYAIPLLALLFYIYVTEIKAARRSRNWDAIFAGLTLFGMDFVNETWNGWVMVLSERSAFWTAPGPTALRTMVGWNLEIMFMFAISGIIFYHTWSEDRRTRILGLPNRWFWAIGYSIFCVVVELALNAGGHLVWEYDFWNASFGGVWLIFLIGYFHFYVATILVLQLRTNRAKVIAIASIWGVAVVMNVIGMGILGWTY